jgi:trehalose 6-phosphate synthase/phosphatase
VEEKTAGLAWHYRMADPELAAAQADKLRARLEEALSDSPFEVLLGSKVVEVRTRGVNKGLAVSRLRACNGDSTSFLAMGDDKTDEDMFTALPPGGISVHVGLGPTRANYKLVDVGAARSFLRDLLNSRKARAVKKEQAKTV